MRGQFAAGNYLALITDKDGCAFEKNNTINDDCIGKINCVDDYITVNNQYDAFMYQFANDTNPFDGEIASFEVSQPTHASVDPLSLSNIGKNLNKMRCICITLVMILLLGKIILLTPFALMLVFFIFNLSDFDEGLYYLHIQHLDYPDFSTTTILRD